MAGSLDSVLAARLVLLEQDGLRRRLPPPGSPACQPPPCDFSSNDYLGLASDPWLSEVASEAFKRFGSGSGASRLLRPNQAPHRGLEESLALWKKTEAALCFSSGYATALGVLGALLTRDDVVVLDKLCHASLIDGARLSGAQIRVFPHNHLGRLEKILRQIRSTNPSSTVLVVTEGVFSMDGDRAPLKEIAALKNRFGAALLVDEAHSAGVLGEAGRGLAAELNVDSEIDIQMGTLSKAFGCAGGYVCGSQTLVNWLINRARSFVYSTAPPPAVAAAAQAALEWTQTEEGRLRRAALHRNMDHFQTLLQRPQPSPSPIFPIPAPGASAVMAWSAELATQGFRIPAIRFPTVARGAERLRLTVTARHSSQELEAVSAALVCTRPRPPQPV
jgi:8-amino-7-oxononanoate synthase